MDGGGMDGEGGWMERGDGGGDGWRGEWNGRISGDLSHCLRVFCVSN